MSCLIFVFRTCNFNLVVIRNYVFEIKKKINGKSNQKGNFSSAGVV